MVLGTQLSRSGHKPIGTCGKLGIRLLGVTMRIVSSISIKLVTVVFRLKVARSKTQHISAKLLMRWSKPVVIAKIVGLNTVLLANPDTGVIVRRAHVSQLTPFVRLYTVYSSNFWYVLFVTPSPGWRDHQAITVP
jgi:hypothetical protein